MINRPGDYTPDSLADEVNKAGEEGGGGGEITHNLCQTGRANRGMEALLGRYSVRGGGVGGWLLLLTDTNWSY